MSYFNPFVTASFVKQAFTNRNIWQFGTITLGSWVLHRRNFFKIPFQFACSLLVLVYIWSLDYTFVFLPIQ